VQYNAQETKNGDGHAISTQEMQLKNTNGDQVASIGELKPAKIGWKIRIAQFARAKLIVTHFTPYRGIYIVKYHARTKIALYFEVSKKNDTDIFCFCFSIYIDKSQPFLEKFKMSANTWIAYDTIISKCTPETGSLQDGSDQIFWPFRIMTLKKLSTRSQNPQAWIIQNDIAAGGYSYWKIITNATDDWLSTGDVFADNAQTQLDNIKVLLVHKSAAGAIFTNQTYYNQQASAQYASGDIKDLRFIDIGDTPVRGEGIALGGMLEYANQVANAPSSARAIASVKPQYLADMSSTKTVATRSGNTRYWTATGTGGCISFCFGQWTCPVRTTPFGNIHFKWSNVGSGGDNYFESVGTVGYWDILPDQALTKCCMHDLGTFGNVALYCNESSQACTNGVKAYCTGSNLTTTNCITYCERTDVNCDQEINNYASTLTISQLIANPQLFGCHMPTSYMNEFYALMKSQLPANIRDVIILRPECAYQDCFSNNAIQTFNQKTGQNNDCQSFNICYQDIKVDVSGSHITGDIGIKQDNACKFGSSINTGTSTGTGTGTGTGSSDSNSSTTLILIIVGAIIGGIVFIVILYKAFKSPKVVYVAPQQQSSALAPHQHPRVN
jgi:hypothetical protein